MDLIFVFSIFHGCLDFPQASRPQQNGTYEDMTGRYVIVASVFSRENSLVTQASRTESKYPLKQIV